MSSAMSNVRNTLAVAGQPPYFQVMQRKGEWVEIRRFRKGVLEGPLLRRKVVRKKGGEMVRLPVRGPLKYAAMMGDAIP